MSDSGQIFSSTKNLSIGTSGQDVRDLQTALNLRPPSSLPILNPDGMFGAKTDARVKEFQGNKGLVADGIVGPKTRAALAGLDFPTTDHGSNCCNPENFSSGQSREVSEFLRNNRSSAGNKSGFSAGTGSGSFASAGASLLQPLTIAQIGQAKVVYGASLDFSSIFISRQTGVGGRPFTFAFDDNGSTVQIMNCGSFTPRPRTLIHELAHV